MNVKLLLLSIVLGFITFGIILYWQFDQVQSKYEGYQITIYKLENKTHRLLVADEPDKWERGLMFYRSLDGVDGMVFEFPDKDYRSFWNKNTFMDLNLSWINDQKVEGKDFLPSIERSKEIVTVSSPTKVNTVVEMPEKN